MHIDPLPLENLEWEYGDVGERGCGVDPTRFVSQSVSFAAKKKKKKKNRFETEIRKWSLLHYVRAGDAKQLSSQSEYVDSPTHKWTGRADSTGEGGGGERIKVWNTIKRQKLAPTQYAGKERSFWDEISLEAKLGFGRCFRCRFLSMTLGWVGWGGEELSRTEQVS